MCSETDERTAKRSGINVLVLFFLFFHLFHHLYWRLLLLEIGSRLVRAPHSRFVLTFSFSFHATHRPCDIVRMCFSSLSHTHTHAGQVCCCFFCWMSHRDMWSTKSSVGCVHCAAWMCVLKCNYSIDRRWCDTFPLCSNTYTYIKSFATLGCQPLFVNTRCSFAYRAQFRCCHIYLALGIPVPHVRQMFAFAVSLAFPSFFTSPCRSSRCRIRTSKMSDHLLKFLSTCAYVVVRIAIPISFHLFSEYICAENSLKMWNTKRITNDNTKIPLYSTSSVCESKRS